MACALLPVAGTGDAPATCSRRGIWGAVRGLGAPAGPAWVWGRRGPARRGAVHSHGQRRSAGTSDAAEPLCTSRGGLCAAPAPGPRRHRAGRRTAGRQLPPSATRWRHEAAVRLRGRRRGPASPGGPGMERSRPRAAAAGPREGAPRPPTPAAPSGRCAPGAPRPSDLPLGRSDRAPRGTLSQALPEPRNRGAAPLRPQPCVRPCAPGTGARPPRGCPQEAPASRARAARTLTGRWPRGPSHRSARFGVAGTRRGHLSSDGPRAVTSRTGGWSAGTARVGQRGSKRPSSQVTPIGQAPPPRLLRERCGARWPRPRPPRPRTGMGVPCASARAAHRPWWRLHLSPPGARGASGTR